MPEAANILLCPVGSAGDVFPFVGLGVALKQRGHRVTVLTSEYFQETIERVGLEFVDLMSKEQFLQLAGNPLLWHPIRGVQHILDTFTVELIRDAYQAVADRYEPGNTVLATSCIGFGPRLAHDRLGIPLVTIDLQPAVLWSNIEPPVMHGLWQWAPPWLKQFQFWVGETFALDPHIVPKLNVVRHELGLPSMRKTTRWWHSPQCILGLFPDWYAARQPDWPPHVHLTQFPLWNELTDEPLSTPVEEFLAAGEPPIVFTPGSANMFGEEFFRAAVEACQTLGRRGMLFTRFAEQIPTLLPEEVRHFEYAPFQQVLPRCCAISHHGGIGTTAQAMAAGIPQLIMPLSHDQPDNAHRVRRLNVGDFLEPDKYRGPAVAAKLQALLDNPAVAQACAQVKRRFEGVDPYAQACDVVESIVGRDRQQQ